MCDAVLVRANAEPVELSDFHWKNRLIVACDLTGSQVADRDHRFVMTAARIVLDDIDGDRRLAFVNVSEKTWSVMVDSPDDLSAGISTQNYICPDCDYDYTEAHRQEIARRLACRSDDQVVALIGLDGEIKATWRDQVPSSAEVYALIDAMPMRVQELRDAEIRLREK